MSMTAGTIEYPFRERHLLPMSTDAACLTRIGRVNFDQRAPSLFRFGAQLGKECRPGGICNAFGKTMIMHHPVDRQIFHTDDTEPINNLTAFLVGEVITPELDTLMDTSHNLPMLASLRRTFRQLRVFPLHFRQGLFFRPVSVFLTKRYDVPYN